MWTDIQTVKSENMVSADRHGVGEAGVVGTGTKRPLGQAGLKQLYRLHDFLMEVLCWLVGHLKVQVVRIKPGGKKQRCEPAGTMKWHFAGCTIGVIISNKYALRHWQITGKPVSKPSKPNGFTTENHIRFRTDVRTDSSTVPLYWISEHDDDFGSGLDCVDEVLRQEGGLCLLPAAVKIAPGLVVPHSGCTGFTCQDIDSFSITWGNKSSFKMQWVLQT